MNTKFTSILASFALALTGLTQAQTPGVAATGTLRTAVQMPIVINGKVVGNGTFQPGTPVKVLQENGDKVLVSNSLGTSSAWVDKAQVAVTEATPAPTPVAAATPIPTATPEAATTTNNPATPSKGRIFLALREHVVHNAAGDSQSYSAEDSKAIAKALEQEGYTVTVATPETYPALKNLDHNTPTAQCAAQIKDFDFFILGGGYGHGNCLLIRAAMALGKVTAFEIINEAETFNYLEAMFNNTKMPMPNNRQTHWSFAERKGNFIRFLNKNQLKSGEVTDLPLTPEEKADFMVKKLLPKLKEAKPF